MFCEIYEKLHISYKVRVSETKTLRAKDKMESRIGKYLVGKWAVA